jgi:predicted cupin superfamily sugar epimerase
MTADQVKALLGLTPHPREGGCYIRTYESQTMAEGGARRCGTAIYYLLEPGTFSEMHRLASDEIFHFYAGDSVEQLQLDPNGSGKLILLGNDLATTARPQVIVPAGVWQGARLVEGGAWALMGCTVTPGFEFEDYEAGQASALTSQWPEWAAAIGQLCRDERRR